MYKILFIDEDVEYLKIMSDVLTKSGYEVDSFTSAVEGLEAAKNEEYDLVLAELFLQKFNGIQLVEIIKRYNSSVEIILLSSSKNPNDELKCLQSRATDFISKDCSIDIFLTRVDRILGNLTCDRNGFLTSPSEGVEVDLNMHLVKKNDQVVHLTKTEYDLLTLFLKNKNDSLSREKIIREVWNQPVYKSRDNLNIINAHIKNLKKKLNVKSIISIRGVGYRWYER